MLEIIGNEHVNLSEKQMAELIELLDKEEILEVESKIQKALDKAAVAAKEQDKSSDSEGKVCFLVLIVASYLMSNWGHGCQGIVPKYKKACLHIDFY